MAQMPKGEPRSVPDPAADKVDAMLRQERLKKQQAEAVAAKQPGFSAMPRLSPFERRIEDLDLAQRPSRVVTIGGQAYKDVDNGQANVLVPAGDPLLSPAELAARRQGIVRALFMAEHPFGAISYGVASIAGASPRTLDATLQAGGLVDEMAMGGRSPRTVRLQQPSPVIKAPRTPAIRFGELNAKGQATGVTASVTPDMLGTGTKARRRIKPPGLDGDSRGHLFGNQLGGSGHDPRNLVALTQYPYNSPQMSNFEGAVARRVRAGEAIEYTAKPLYREGPLPPSAVLLTATGPRQPPTARLIHNPAGHRR